MILKSGHLAAEPGDAKSYGVYCGPPYVDAIGRVAAEVQARTMLQMLGKLP